MWFLMLMLLLIMFACSTGLFNMNNSQKKIMSGAKIIKSALRAFWILWFSFFIILLFLCKHGHEINKNKNFCQNKTNPKQIWYVQNVTKLTYLKKYKKQTFVDFFLTKNLNSLSFFLSIGLNDKFEIIFLLYNSKKKIDIEILFNFHWRFKGYSHFPSLTKNSQFYFFLKFDKFKSFEKKHFHFLNHEEKRNFLNFKIQRRIIFLLCLFAPY